MLIQDAIVAIETLEDNELRAIFENIIGNKCQVIRLPDEERLYILDGGDIEVVTNYRYIVHVPFSYAFKTMDILSVHPIYHCLPVAVEFANMQQDTTHEINATEWRNMFRVEV